MINELVNFHDLAPEEDSFEAAVLNGLSRSRKAIPCKFLYDQRGSKLFDEICRLPEYYPTRTEIGILEDRAPAIAGLMGAGVQLIELGSGSSHKIRVLLDLLNDVRGYVAIDISSEHLRQAAEAVAPTILNYRSLWRAVSESVWLSFPARRSAISCLTRRLGCSAPVGGWSVGAGTC
jgi:uncharacterized SAM-dependent methyltransferase